MTSAKVVATVGVVGVLGVGMFLQKSIAGIFANFSERVGHVFADGEGLAVKSISPERSAELVRKAQAEKASVDPTIAGFEALAQITQANSAKNVAGIRYIGAEAEALTQQVEAIADLSDVMAEASPRVQAALARMNQNVEIFSAEYEAIMFGEEEAPRTQAITGGGSGQKMLFASR